MAVTNNCVTRAAKLDALIRTNLKGIGYGG